MSKQLVGVIMISVIGVVGISLVAVGFYPVETVIIGCFAGLMVATVCDPAAARSVWVIQHVGEENEPVVAVRATREEAEDYAVGYLRYFVGDKPSIEITPNGVVTLASHDDVVADDYDHPDLNYEVNDLICMYITEVKV